MPPGSYRVPAQIRCIDEPTRGVEMRNTFGLMAATALFTMLLSGCSAVHTLKPPLAQGTETGLPLDIISYSYMYKFNGKPRSTSAKSNHHQKIVHDVLQGFGDISETPFDEREMHRHIHIEIDRPLVDESGYGYWAHLTLFLIPIVYEIDPRVIYRYTYYRDGTPERSAQFVVQTKNRLSVWYLIPMLLAMSENTELNMFRDSLRAFLNGSGGYGLQGDGVASADRPQKPWARAAITSNPASAIVNPYFEIKT